MIRIETKLAGYRGYLILFIDDHDWTFSGGFLWNLSGSWRVGGVYRQGFDVGIGNDITAGVAVDYGVPPGTIIISNRGVPIEFPDVFGLGLAWRGLQEKLTLSFQWDRIGYSSIPQSMGLDDQAIDDADEMTRRRRAAWLKSRSS